MGIRNGNWEWGLGMDQCLGHVGKVKGGLPSPPPSPPLVRTESARRGPREWGLGMGIGNGDWEWNSA